MDNFFKFMDTLRSPVHDKTLGESPDKKKKSNQEEPELSLKTRISRASECLFSGKYQYYLPEVFVEETRKSIDFAIKEENTLSRIHQVFKRIEQDLHNYVPKQGKVDNKETEKKTKEASEMYQGVCTHLRDLSKKSTHPLYNLILAETGQLNFLHSKIESVTLKEKEDLLETACKTFFLAGIKNIEHRYVFSAVEATYELWKIYERREGLSQKTQESTKRVERINKFAREKREETAKLFEVFYKEASKRSSSLSEKAREYFQQKFSGFQSHIQSN